MKKFLALIIMSACSLAAATNIIEVEQRSLQEECYKTARLVKQIFMLRQLNPDQTEVQSNASFYVSTKNSGDPLADPLIETFKRINAVSFQFDANTDPESVQAAVYVACVK